ncbi:MAG: MYXO-CTERM sorting domain-containing protein [Chthoniobacterales bacterium]
MPTHRSRRTELVLPSCVSSKPAPEPGTWAAAALLLGGAAWVRRRRRKS